MMTVNLSDMRKNIGDLVSQVAYGHERLVLRKGKRDFAAVVSMDDLRLLEALERENISTTLVVVVKAGQNDDELGEIIDFALQWKCVRGITFQPVQDAGRNEGFDKRTDRFVLSDIRRRVVEIFSRSSASSACARMRVKSAPRRFFSTAARSESNWR